MSDVSDAPRRPRLAVDVPIPGLAPPDHRHALERLVEAGFDSAWSGEAAGVDALTTLAQIAAWRSDIELVSSIVNVFTRGPAHLATAAGSMAAIAPGRFTFGIGSSSRVIVERWNGIPHVAPFRRVQETLTFLDEILTTGRTAGVFTTFSVDGFRLPPPEVPPRLAIGALGPGMQRLGAAAADAILTGMVQPDDLQRINGNIAGVERARPQPLQIAVGIHVAPVARDAVLEAGRRHLAAYLNVPQYAAHQRWLGRGDLFEEMWERWEAGDRRGALEAIPETVVDMLVPAGTPEACGRRVATYFEAGFDAVNILHLPGVSVPAEERIDFLCGLARSVRGSHP